jgi:hypothetical protein
MSKESRQIHKETAISIATGLMVNFPLNFSLIYLWVEVLEWTDAFDIAASTTAIMTIVAYTRVYMIRRHFHKKSVRELVETQQG